METVHSPLDILGSVLEHINTFVGAHPHSELAHGMMEQALPYIYLIMRLLPTFREVDAQIMESAQNMWISYMPTLQDSSIGSVLATIKGLLQGLLVNVNISQT